MCKLLLNNKQNASGFLVARNRAGSIGKKGGTAGGMSGEPYVCAATNIRTRLNAEEWLSQRAATYPL
ncbi:hypothetical protein PCAR4_10182 [Paraburkholderia caribensis]|nr:hypothetical protein PCAR4_10182 [Paraburkholderia caribensis]